MKSLTDKQKKYLWIAAGVLVFIHFLPRFVNMFHHSAANQTMVRQQPVHAAPPAPAIPSPEEIAATKYGGVWQGEAIMPDTNRCSARLEVRLSDDKKLKGYLSKNCIPLQALVKTPATRGALNEMLEKHATPDSAVMTGTPQPAGIDFAVNQTIKVGFCGVGLDGTFR